MCARYDWLHDMATSVTGDLERTPQERLAISRKAIVRHMQRHDGPEQFHDGERHELDGPPGSLNSGGGKWGAFKRGARAWWHHHPANVALDFAKPVVGEYARNHPFRVLGISASVGAAFVFFKPWRLMSVSGILLAAMKPSDITGFVLSMLTPSPQDVNEQQGNE